MAFETFSSRVALVVGVVVFSLLTWRLRGRRPAITLPVLSWVPTSHRRRRQSLAWIPDVLRGASLLCLLLALARPRQGEEMVVTSTQGVAVMMLVDRSTSMGLPMEVSGRDTLSRMDVVKRVFKSFVLGGDGLPGRPGDLVGLCSFAMFGEYNCPLTLDRQALASFVDNLTLARPEEDRTAIGDGLRHAVLSLVAATASSPVKSRCIVLLSDGEQNAGELSPQEAARLASSHGIRVHCIFVASDLPVQYVDFFGHRIPIQEPPPTGESLRQIASLTGGLFASARDLQSLLDITKRIDAEEKTQLTQRVVRHREQFGPAILAGLVLLGVELLARATVLHRIP